MEDEGALPPSSDRIEGGTETQVCESLQENDPGMDTVETIEVIATVEGNNVFDNGVVYQLALVEEVLDVSNKPGDEGNVVSAGAGEEGDSKSQEADPLQSTDPEKDNCLEEDESVQLNSSVIEILPPDEEPSNKDSSVALQNEALQTNQMVPCDSEDFDEASKNGPTSHSLEGSQEEVEQSEGLSFYHNVPCLACGSNCFIKLEGDHEDSNVVDSFELFKQMCKVLGIKTHNVHWSSESERLPICGDCSNQVSLLLDLKQRYVEIERDFKNGVAEFKELCKKSEIRFSESGIYHRDIRYHRIRKQIARGCGAPRRTYRKQYPTTKEGHVPSRRSLRGPKSIRTNSVAALPSYSPVVSVSLYDKEKADEYHVKTELPSDSETENNSNLDDDNFVLDSPVTDHSSSRNDFLGHEVGVSFTNSVTSLPLPPPPPVVSYQSQQSTQERDELQLKRKRGRKAKISATKKLQKNKSDPVPKPKKEKKLRYPKISRPSPMKNAKFVIITDPAAEEAFINGDTDSEDEVVKQKRTRKRKDRDYEPDVQPEEEDYDDADEDPEKPNKWWTEEERTHRDPATGNCTFMQITFQPLSDGSGKFLCLECDETVSRSMFRKHTFKYHTNRFKCKECGKCEGGPAALRNHIRYFHREVKPKNECPICGKPVSSVKDRMLSHMSTHYSEQEKEEAIARGEKLRFWKDRRNIQCDHCGKKFTSKKELERHNISRHPKPEDAESILSYKELCPECGKMVDRHYMKIHRMRSHNITTDANLAVGTVLSNGPEANKRFICTLCDRRFYKNMELVRHKMSVHEKNYPFKCELCPRSFLLKQQLQRHMNTHLNIRPFACTHCPMAFFTNGNLTRHIATYHAEGANPKRKAYVRGGQSTNVISKRHMPKPKPQNPPPPFAQDSASLESSSSSVVNLSTEGNAKKPESIINNAPKANPESSSSASKPPAMENEFLDNLMLQSSTANVTVHNSTSFMQEFFIRQNHHI